MSSNNFVKASSSFCPVFFELKDSELLEDSEVVVSEPLEDSDSEVSSLRVREDSLVVDSEMLEGLELLLSDDDSSSSFSFLIELELEDSELLSEREDSL